MGGEWLRLHCRIVAGRNPCVTGRLRCSHPQHLEGICALPVAVLPWAQGTLNPDPISRPNFDPEIVCLQTVLCSQPSQCLCCSHVMGPSQLLYTWRSRKDSGQEVRLLAVLSCTLQLFDSIFNSELNRSREGLP